MKLRELIERITADGVVTTEEHQMILTAVSEDGKLDQQEAEEIKHLMLMINQGKIKLK